MTTIYKYPILITDWQQVEMPSNATILCVQLQGDVLCLWARVDPERTPTQRTIYIYGTGRACRSGGIYIGTVQQFDGTLVWHVFEA